MLYLYPLPPKTRLDTVIETKLREQVTRGTDGDHDSVARSEAHRDYDTVQLGYAAGPGLISLQNCSWVTVRDITVTGSTGTAVTISGGENNTVGGCTFKNGNGGVALEGITACPCIRRVQPPGSKNQRSRKEFTLKFLGGAFCLFVTHVPQGLCSLPRTNPDPLTR